MLAGLSLGQNLAWVCGAYSAFPIHFLAARKGLSNQQVRYWLHCSLTIPWARGSMRFTNEVLPVSSRFLAIQPSPSACM